MICPYCKKAALWTSNDVVYGKRYGKSFMCYYCKDCDAYVGCHENSKRPLGTMANKELRQWRMKAHAVFDPLWREKVMSRKSAYAFLRRHFGKEVHIGEADIATCKKIIELCNPQGHLF